ncbi:hypothetical protein McanCB56680_000522 [Microsporum canis]|uniref:Amidoligase enzyme n=1 Tax=Arthroderma otae (strain ATCC MYA-4605 / CBS 113480) TaxID=554155 RepID=C5FUK9_ARTOC|nr:uncharacterized protein MCYG_06412 [Microsporum canis CBS 113480]EEQ33593.1 predicted protein [Microsporum canis CBS 113480]
MTTPTLSFGIELELYLKPTSEPLLQLLGSSGFYTKNIDQTQKFEAVRKVIAAMLTKNFIPAQTDKTHDFRKWIVASEILDKIGGGHCPCEIVSPILYTDQADWTEEVDGVFRVLREHCDIKLTTGCAMHVHIAPTHGKYSIEQALAVLNGALYYEAPLKGMMPADRKKNPWAASNVEKLTDCSSMVNLVSKNTWAPVFDHYEVNKDIFHLRAVLGEAERYVSWNFLNITDICGTIEFRRPPAVKASEDAKHWAAFALGFVAGAITVENRKEIDKTDDGREE